MNKKIALFLFAIGLGMSSAQAFSWECMENCRIAWNECKQNGGGATECTRQRTECQELMCGY